MKKFAKLWDTVAITPACVDNFRQSVNDQLLSAGGERVLRVEIAATHAGRLTRNYGFYLPQKMKDGAHTLLQNYGKPMLVHHSSHDDPVGRIVDAKYIDTSGAFVRDEQFGSVFRDLCNPNTPFVKSLSLVDKVSDSDIFRDPSYPGLGYILATVDISDEEAIKKILDKRYLTVSIGASTDKAICSICKQDFVEEGPCEHRPGKTYDDKLAFIIAGSLVYDEISFVNVPADTLARVVSIHNSARFGDDSIVVEESTRTCYVNTNFYFMESVGGTSMNKIQDAWNKVQEAIDTKDADKKDKIKALEDFLKEFGDKEDEELVKKANGLLADLKKEEDNAKDSKDDDKKEDDSKDTDNQDQEPDEADKHYEDMIKFGYDLALFDEDFEDKKLSAGQRKKMAKSVFCKPSERKYPVPDCSHARVAMAYAKKYGESASVIACIRRKAKALGCPFNGKKDAFEEWEKTELEEILRDLEKNDTKDQKKEDSDNKDADSKKTTDDCEPCMADEKLAALRQELKDIYAEYEEMQQSHVEEIKTLKAALADATARLDFLAGSTDKEIDAVVQETVKLPMEDLVKKAESLRDSLDLEQIVVKLNDGTTGTPSEKVPDPTLSDNNDPSSTGDKKDEDDLYRRYREKYGKIAKTDGFKAADAFLLTLKQAGLVPVDFNPETE